mgnify:CR=1 FL=1
MSIRPFRDIKRRVTKVVNVGKVKIGGNNPISVQSMTNTLTQNVKETLNQINKISEVGGDIVRVSCPDEESTNALKKITKHSPIPVVADIHFHFKRAIEAAENGADCLRINPGNIGDKNKIAQVISAAKNNNCSIRVGVNAGSLEKDILEKFKEPCPEALVESAIRNIKILEDLDARATRYASWWAGRLLFDRQSTEPAFTPLKHWQPPPGCLCKRLPD